MVSHKLGVSKVDPSGKPCSTCFTRLSYNGTTSVVKCEWPFQSLTAMQHKRIVCIL